MEQPTLPTGAAARVIEKASTLQKLTQARAIISKQNDTITQLNTEMRALKTHCASNSEIVKELYLEIDKLKDIIIALNKVIHEKRDM